ncbi:lambda family phage portal protein [Hoeflea halophila]|uniref:Lambda family phage portal protein n=1 Tax=Hoeflea halophila TaxID=714899 RepID=A0A286IFC3_9HYPH|nr:phage portal protein [Hoeflea halophila]SOE18843.1 lambda family phage portal protein [Hoeflea halophila]
MFERMKAALGMGGGGGEAVVTPGANLSRGPEIPAGSFAGGIETAHIDGIFRDTGDAVMDAAPLTNARAVRALFDSDLGGAVDVALGQIVGTGLRPNVQPVIELTGMTQREADAWARRVERLFALWASDPRECDAAGSRSFGQMQRTAGRAYFGPGEILATFPTKRRTGNLFSAKVSLLDAHRLAENGIDESDRHGLRFAGGEPVGVRIRDRDPATGMEDFSARFVPFRSRSGRPLSALLYDHVAPVQWRGLSPLTAALKPHFQYGKLADATLATSILQTVLAAVVTSNATSEEVMQMFSHGDVDQTAMDAYTATKVGWYRQNSLKGLPNVIHALPGEQVDFKSPTTDPGDLGTFARLLKLESARALGIGYSAATGDYSGATYSSVRMETAVNWPIVLQRRGIIGRFCQLVFEAWLENAILDGTVPVPGGYLAFLAMRPAWTRCEWRGPSMPQADENKSASAAAKRLETGTTSLATECEALGLDWQDVLAQRAREKEMASNLGLPDPHVADPKAAPAAPARATPQVTLASGEAMDFTAAVERLEQLEANQPQRVRTGRAEDAKARRARDAAHKAAINKWNAERADLEAALAAAQE